MSKTPFILWAYNKSGYISNVLIRSDWILDGVANVRTNLGGRILDWGKDGSIKNREDEWKVLCW